nr:hypothetical protein MACL_00003082 [Theileria orientalis]
MKVRSQYCTILTLALLCHFSTVTCPDIYKKSFDFCHDRGTDVFLLCGEKSYSPPRNTRYKPEGHFITLNIWDTFNSRAVKFIRDDRKNADNFIARYPYLFYRIKSGDRVLWRSKGNKYVHKLKVIYTENGKYRIKVVFVEFNRRSGQFTPPGHPIVNINIKHCRSTDVFKYNNRGHVHIFTARRPYLFNTVFNGNNVIWAPRTYEYPDIVFVKFRTYGNNLLRVYFPREAATYLDLSRHRHRRPLGYESFDGGEDTVQKHRDDAYKLLQDIKIITEGSSQQNDVTKFDVYKVGNADDFYLFKFKDGVQCTEVKYVHKMTNPRSAQILTEERTVWKHGLFDNATYPRAIYSHGVFKFMFLEFNENYFIFYRKSASGKEWKHVLLQNVSSLDISRVKIITYSRHYRDLTELPPDRYLLYNLGFAYQFVFKDDARCEQIKLNDEFLYIHDRSREYPLFIYLLFNKSCEVVYRDTAHYVYA